MPKRKMPPPPAEDQFKRFVEYARKHEIDETGKEFDRGFRKMASANRSERKSKG